MLSIEDRNKIIVHFLPKVNLIAGRIYASIPVGIVRKEDLCSYGVFGLINAIKKYDRNRGCSFSTYAGYRIKGHILDEIRKLDIMPKLLRQQIKKFHRAEEKLELELSRPPTPEEIAKSAGFIFDEYREIKRTFDRKLSPYTYEESQERDSYVDLLIDRIDEHKRVKDIFLAFHNLPRKRLREIMILYYQVGKNINEIGQAYRISPNRAFQLIEQGKTLVREKLRRKYVF